MPLLYDAEDARKLVSSAKFPPTGVRGFGSPFPMGTFGIRSGTEYLQQANDSLLTIVQIETKEALQNVSLPSLPSLLHVSCHMVLTAESQVDAIAKVPGVDVLFVGPFDLGNNIGRPILDGTMHDELQSGIARVLKAANDNEKKAGIYCTSGEQSKTYADDGFHMVSDSVDIM